MDKLLDRSKDDTCPSCHKNSEQEMHTCPFFEEIRNDSRLCSCCEQCEKNCENDK